MKEKEINLGPILVENRHKRGITQDELAEYMGVSKAAVSKWETQSTYPDITLLPRLATFFNISIDELMGYQPQMTKSDIRKLYRQLCLDFSTKPFDEVVEHCRQMAKKYFSCPPLLFQIGALFVNHSTLANSREKTTDVLEEALGYFIRVKDESDDIELAKQALNMEALCLLTLGRANEVLDLLEPAELSLTSVEPLLASAYHMSGQIEQSKRVLQIGVYQSIVNLLNLLLSYMGLCCDDAKTFEETYRRTYTIAEAFQIEDLHPGLLMSFFISAAQGFMILGDEEKALDLLEQYVDLVTRDIYPLHLHGDSYFNLLDDWFETTLTLGSDLPRDETIIRKSMTEAVVKNPTFAPLADNTQFQRIKQRLKANEEV
ncbi:helix-turn-helix domain-containing protein [Solibaculum mannosilyticum]|uniref:helix-turn-helix domain-containing protein n=1 Tax=Solibaculum mannosilyticum TaxID=2780922 RepID=UPI0034C1E409